ncbi:hypothetical protein GAMM_40004 [Gammaproteobacteria bacterium]
MSKDSIAAGKSSGNLNFSVAQKMIHQLLTMDRIKTALDDGKVINLTLCNEPKIRLAAYTKDELAKKLGITTKELEKLKIPNFYKGIASKISLPLSRLYCATKFADSEYKKSEL